MSLDRSLKSSATMATNRSVMKRTERIAKMIETKKMDPAKNGRALGLPKTRVGKA
jgi:small basic protein (TIGR04137 family)